MTYVKLFSSLLDSTLWFEDATTRITWITLLLKADRDGMVYTSVPGLAHAARVTAEECDKAIESFMSKDENSSSPEHDGRRIEVVDRGFRILNYEKYRDFLSSEDQREKAAERQRRKRERDKRVGIVKEGN